MVRSAKLAVLFVTACVMGMAAPRAWAQGNQVTTVPIVASSDYLMVGDGNCNGVSGVTATDAQLLKQYIAGLKMPSHTEHIRCDANQNGRLDHDDVDKILKRAVGTLSLPISRYRAGDADGSGTVTAVDASIIALYLKHTPEKTTFPSIMEILRRLLGQSTDPVQNLRVYNADCNSDGLIDDRDVKGALDIAVGLTCK